MTIGNFLLCYFFPVFQNFLGAKIEIYLNNNSNNYNSCCSQLFAGSQYSQVSVACKNREGLFLDHITCLGQIGIGSPDPCVFSFHNAG